MNAIQRHMPSPILAAIHGRRSVSPRRLRPPGPSLAVLRDIAAAGLAAPDHGLLRPWRLLNLDREALAHAFAAALTARRADASDEELARERGKALNAPVQLALVARVDACHADIPVHEQWIAVGTALQNMLLAIEAHGFGAKIVSGYRCEDPVIRDWLGIADVERLAGFISVGTVADPPRPRTMTNPESVLAIWPARRRNCPCP